MMSNANSSKFRNHYKKSGASSCVDGRLKRAQQRLSDRRALRADEFTRQRNISPLHEKKETEKVVDLVKLKLQQWKKNKQQLKLKEKSKEKPAFKVGYVFHKVGSPYLTDISNTNHVKTERKQTISNVKSKPLNAKRLLIQDRQSFAPENFKFKAPVIKPAESHSIEHRRNKEASQKNTNTSSKSTVKRHTNNVPVSQRVTRSQTRSENNKELIHISLSSHGRGKKTKSVEMTSQALVFTTMETLKEENVKETPQKVELEDVTKHVTPKKGVKEETFVEQEKSEDNENIIHAESQSSQKSAETETVLCTPEVQLPIQYSPFVTKERGSSKKRSARRSIFNVNSDASMRGSPVLETADRDENRETLKKHGICYFRSVLETETLRLESLCDEWLNIESTTKELPQDASDLIRGAIGMTKLLIRKKFTQFKSLVDICENGPKADGKPVTCSDLDGFWEMMYMEVENIDCRFNNLRDLKSNNWVEIIPETEKPKPRAPSKRQKNVKISAKSSLKAMISAARKKQKMEEVNPGIEAQTAEICMPDKKDSPAVTRTPSSHQSLLHQAIMGQKRQSRGVSRQSSPIIMKVTQMAKMVNDGCSTDSWVPDSSNDLEVPMPTSKSFTRKSILKSAGIKDQGDKVTKETKMETDAENCDSKPSRKSTRKVRFEGGTNNNSPGEAQPMTPYVSNKRRSNSKQKSNRLSFLNGSYTASPVISTAVDLISFDSPTTEPLRVRRRSSRLNQSH